MGHGWNGWYVAAGVVIVAVEAFRLSRQVIERRERRERRRVARVIEDRRMRRTKGQQK